MVKTLSDIKNVLLKSLIVLFPLFFLTTTQDFFITNKFYLLGIAVLLLLVISVLEIAFSRKISWVKRALDVPVLIFVTTVALSLLLSSSNKIQAVTNPNFGLAMFVFLAVIYFYASRTKFFSSVIYYILSGALSVLTIFLFLQPFRIIKLAPAWQFLQNPQFSTLGGVLDLSIFLGFFATIAIVKLIEKKHKPIDLVLLGLNVVALIMAVYSLFHYQLLILPPLSVSWYATLEALKTVKTAFFGVGIGNFSAVFTKAKDAAYNQSSLWQITSFNVARIIPLQILTEMGILGFLSFSFMVFNMIGLAMKQPLKTKAIIGYAILILLLFPPSLPVFFLLFMIMSFLAEESGDKNEKSEVNLKEIPALYAGILFVLVLVIFGLGYLIGRSYLAEYYFKKSIDGLSQNNIKDVYDNMRQARILNPYEERFILNFSQTNLLIADSLANKTDVTAQDRQTIAQAIQAAISEAKELIRLNPDKAQYFENLANVYKNIITIAQGADVWAISSYQRAIILDPANPSYRLNLGGIYYLLGQYSDAASFFSQAVSLKPDWSNGYYNLAWSYYQNKEYDKAALAMNNVLQLIDKKSAPSDWNKANQDLENFKNKLASSQSESTGEGKLNLPQAPTSNVKPKINLPKEASPEAK